MRAMIAENWLHHRGDRGSTQGRAILAEIRNVFLLDDREWQDALVARTREVVQRALDGLARFAPGAAPSPEPRVRPARAGDLEALVGFSVAMARETEGRQLPADRVRAGTAALLADPARGRAFVVEAAGEVVGGLVLTLEWSDWRNGFYWWIQNVYVRPPHRWYGHYRRLHDHVRRLAAADPTACGLRLYVERENRAARAAYEALGMTETEYRLYVEAL
jgi:ribosomal protein S18 acetylase RimI-like enzyme